MLTAVGICVIVLGCASHNALIKRIEEDYCRTVDDPLDLGPDDLASFSRLEKEGPEMRAALIRVAKSDRVSRNCATSYLCRLQDDSVLPIILPTLRAIAGEVDPPPTEGETITAIRCVGQFVEPSFEREVVPFVYAPNERIAAAAIVTLGEINKDEAREALRRVASSPPENRTARVREGLQQLAVRALGAQQDPKAVAVLRQVANQPELSDWTRREVVEALYRIGNTDGLVAAANVALGVAERNERVRLCDRVLSELSSKFQSIDRDTEEWEIVRSAIESLKAAVRRP